MNFEEKEMLDHLHRGLLTAYRSQIQLSLESACIPLESALANLNLHLCKKDVRALLSEDEEIEVWERIQKLQRIIDDVKYLAKPL